MNAIRNKITEPNGPHLRLSLHEIWERVQDFPTISMEPLYKFDGMAFHIIELS